MITSFVKDLVTILQLHMLAGIFFLFFLNKNRHKIKKYISQDLTPALKVLSLLWLLKILLINFYVFNNTFHYFEYKDRFADEIISLMLFFYVSIEYIIIILTDKRIVKIPKEYFINKIDLLHNLYIGTIISSFYLLLFFYFYYFSGKEDYYLFGLDSNSCSNLSILLIIFNILVMAPIIEEIIYRGYLFFIFERSIGKFGSVIFTSFLWAIAHMPHDFINKFFYGIILGFFYIKYRSIMIPILLHMSSNLSYFIKWII